MLSKKLKKVILGFVTALCLTGSAMPVICLLYTSIHIVGGGSNAGYLNELTAKATKKEIHAGPGEATAIGNITAQMLKAEEFKTIEEARTIIHESFGVKVYK